MKEQSNSLVAFWYELSYRVRYTLAGAAFGCLFPIVSSFMWVFLNDLPLTFTNLLRAQVNNPLQWMIDSAPLFLGLFASFAGARQDHTVVLNRELESRLQERSRLINELEGLRHKLELQVGKQINQLRTTAQVASDIVRHKDLQAVLDGVARSISERLGYYHAGIFLLDEAHEFAVLRAASSKGGQAMLAREHRLRIGQVGMVGYAAEKGQPRVAHDVGQDAAFFNNPDLPATRSEVALPLKVGERIIGVLDIQSVKMGDFSPDDLAVLQTMADQVSLVIENARLAQERTQAAGMLKEYMDRQSQDAWRTVLSQNMQGIRFDGLDIFPESEQQVEALPTSFEEDKQPERILRQPIILNDLRLGTLTLKRQPDMGAWSADERKYVQSVASQIAIAIENARLLEENQRRAQSEQIISAISARTQSSLDLDSVMKIAVQEIGQALGALRVEMRLEPEPNGASQSSRGAASSAAKEGGDEA